ncbi:MAG: O-antigen ligase family protein [Myxococcota bacterium]|nr:O-antigen ligase family protein [Myxococcota bacterium]
MISSARWLATLATSGAVLLVLLLFAPALHEPFLVPKLAALEVTASVGLVAFALRGAAGREASSPRWNRELTIGAWLVLGTTAAAWMVGAGRPWGAPYGLAAMTRWGSFFGLACAASVLDDSAGARQRVLEAVTITGAIVALIGLLQHVELLPLSIPIISTPGSTFGNRNYAAEVIAMSLPLGVGAAGMRQGSMRTAILVSLGLELVFLAVTRTRGAWIGAACGLGVALAMARVRGWRASAGVAVVAVVAAVFAVTVRAPFNARDAGDTKRYSGVVEVLRNGFDLHSNALRTRVGLWRRTSAMARDYPVFGVGPGSWPVVFPLYAEPGATRDGVLSATLAPRQAHNDVLERAAETGVPGLVALGSLVVGAFVSVRRRLRREQHTRGITAGSAGALVALMALSVASFPLESPGTLALAGLALGLIATDTAPGEGRSPASSRPAKHVWRPLSYAALMAAIALVPFVAIRAERNVRASRWLSVAERAMRRDAGPQGARAALLALERATAANPRGYRAHLRAAQMLLREGRPRDSADAARDALRTEPHAPNAWAALAAAELAAGDATAARREAARALELLQNFPFALDVHARAALAEGDVEAADRDGERLDVLAAGAAEDDTTRAARALRADANRAR